MADLPQDIAFGADCAFQMVEEHRAQLCALICNIEGDLGKSCNEGNDPPGSAPLNAWRLSQVMRGMLESNEIEESLRVYLGLKPVR